MKKATVKRILCAMLCILIVTAFAGCGTKTPVSESAGVDMIEKLTALMVSDKDLGIAGKYTKLSEIEDGSIDADLVGTWITADGETTYTYSEDGVIRTTNTTYGDNEATFTCITVGDYKIVCEEVELSSEFYDGAQPGDTQLSYAAYSVENDVLYQVIVEEVNEDYTSNMSALVTLFRADESGSAAAAIEKNPIDMNALNGTWASDEKGSFTIEDGVLTLGADSYNVFFNAKNQLVAEKDGQSTAYHMAVSVMKEYDYEDRTQFTESVMLGVSYTGADENDIPNLNDILDSYEYNGWHYSGSFKLQDGSEAADDEDGQNPVMNFIGPYQADRCSLTIMADGMDGAVITASWGNSADSATEWEMHASFDEDTLRLNYSDCTKKNVVYNSDGNVVEETVEYTDGVGRIQLFDDGTLRWENEEEPDTFAGMTFSFAG